MQIADYINPACCQQIRQAILEAEENEVFFIGQLHDGVVQQVKAVARGNADAVVASTYGAKAGDVVIHNHPSGQLEPSPADLNIAGALSQNNIGFYVVDNTAENVYPVSETQVFERIPVDWAKVEPLFMPEGPLARFIEGYELREGQIAMARDVAEALNRSQFALLEAGCGVGKSLAYLVPAAIFALQNRTRVVISTRTLNLQDQLLKQDIPLLKRMLPEDCQTALLKGRSNYLCPRRLDEAQRELSLFADDPEQQVLKDLGAWLTASEEGTYSDLSFTVPEDIWDRVCADADQCSLTDCQKRSDCPYGRARKRAAAAQLLVVNHSLLFSDLSLRRASVGGQTLAILPDYRALVLDEAQHLEEVATQHLGLKADRYTIERLLSRLLHPKGKRGLLLTLTKKIHKIETLAQRQREVWQRQLVIELPQQIDHLRKILAETFTELETALKSYFPNTNDGQSLRVTADIRWEKPFKLGIEQPSQQLIKQLGAILQILKSLSKDVTLAAEENEELLSANASELAALTTQLGFSQDCLVNFFGPLDEDSVYWLNLHGKNLAFHISPLEVGKELRKSLYDQMETIVLTSATLAVDQDFNFFKRRSGLSSMPSSRLIEEIIPSPFPYAENALLGIPHDLPDPREEHFADQLSDFVRQTVTITQGNCFVLFTSFKLLEETYRLLAAPLQSQGLRVLRQGEAGRSALLEQFRQGGGAVLFGTDSFWEGVDVAGSALQAVIITKLPFVVPSDPLIAARSERLEAAGESSFTSYLVPLAVLKLKQGFGRLIRRQSDRGAVLICDRRIVAKSYGQAFLNSLPACHEHIGDQRAVLQQLRLLFASE